MHNNCTTIQVPELPKALTAGSQSSALLLLFLSQSDQPVKPVGNQAAYETLRHSTSSGEVAECLCACHRSPLSLPAARCVVLLAFLQLLRFHHLHLHARWRAATLISLTQARTHALPERVLWLHLAPRVEVRISPRRHPGWPAAKAPPQSALAS